MSIPNISFYFGLATITNVQIRPRVVVPESGLTGY